MYFQFIIQYKIGTLLETGKIIYIVKIFVMMQELKIKRN